MRDPSSWQLIVEVFFASANGVWALGALCALLSGNKASNKVFTSVLFIGSVLMASGILLAWPRALIWTAPYPFYIGIAPFSIGIDPLSSVFLVLLSVVSACVAIYAPAYLEHNKDHFHRGLFWTCLLVFVLAMEHVILSANALTFLVSWELMSLSSVALVATDHMKHSAQKAALIYLGATQVSTAFITAGFLCFHSVFGSWYFSDWHSAAVAPLLPSIILLLGLCIKSGIWPFHGWLPYAHAEAPAPVSALMSSVMVKVALYAIIRILVLGGKAHPAIAYLALTMGLVSAFWGIVYALVQRDLKRLLAYSTVENVGLILTGIALYLLANTSSLTAIAWMAMAAALMHIINHGAFKSLLFLGAGAVDVSAHTRDLGLLGGLSSKMPKTMICFFVASLSICALPPLNGFVSKWLLYRCLLDISSQSGSLLDRAGALFVAALLAVVGALSLACFTKALGVAFLGRARSAHASKASESSKGMLVAQFILAGACVLLGAFASPVLDQLQPVIASAIPQSQTMASVFRLPLGVLLLTGLSLALLLYQIFLNKTNGKLSTFSTWDCGYGDLPGRAEISGTSFADSIATLISPLLAYKVARAITGKDRRHFPELINVQSSHTPVLEQKVYAPVTAALRAISRLLVTLQTGSIHVHLLYVFMTVFVLVLLGIRL